ncbi:MAG: hypothetical protein Kow0077_08540 [Anaerolineae bacterium]
MSDNKNIQRRVTRRGFLRGTGLAVAALSVAGLPARIGGSARRAFAAVSNLTGGRTHQHSPEVELLNGDVLGFALESDAWTGGFGWVKFRLHEAFFNGESAYFIRTDASDPEFAAQNRLVWVPLLVAALSREGATSQLYVFDDENAAEGQHAVLSTAPEQEDYTPAWQVHSVTFNGSPRLLTSAEEVLAAADAGEVTIEAQNLVVNYPVVKWPGGELAEDPVKEEALGGGPLVEPVDTDRMEVNFKLHQCYPGSRYIITDTSAVPMAPMMAVTGSAPTQLLAEVGAVDNIWAFGNGIPGPAVMGFQPSVFRFEPGTPAWSPFWNHFTVTWKDPDNARVLKSFQDIQEALAAGEIEEWAGTPNTHPNGFVVNCPVPIKARNTFEETLMGGM